MPEVKRTVTNMKKKCVDELSRFVTAEGTINEPEDMSTETSKVKKQRETRLKKKKTKTQNSIQGLWTTTKGDIYMQREDQEEKQDIKYQKDHLQE